MQDMQRFNSADYHKGMEIIISGSVVFSIPFLMAGKQMISQLTDLSSRKPEEVNAEDFSLYPMEELLSEFFTYTRFCIEILTLHFADTIRRETFRSDIKAQTTEAIAGSIRKESFRKLDEVLGIYTSTIQELGIELNNISLIRNAVQGSLVGGALQFMVNVAEYR